MTLEDFTFLSTVDYPPPNFRFN